MARPGGCSNGFMMRAERVCGSHDIADEEMSPGTGITLKRALRQLYFESHLFYAQTLLGGSFVESLMLALIRGSRSTTAGTTLIAERIRCLAQRFVPSVSHALFVCLFAIFLTGFYLFG
jgi:hypothetical protein